MCDANEYIDELDNEEVLLQGVVDCAFFDNDGITVIDFKTDRVNYENLNTIAQGYYSQVQAYANALSKIFNAPIKNAYLYFFAKNSFITVM